LVSREISKIAFTDQSAFRDQAKDIFNRTDELRWPERFDHARREAVCDGLIGHDRTGRAGPIERT
jgi:hypothetical protein